MFEQLKDMICEYVAVEKGQITEESMFVEDLGFSSYDFMALVGEFEEKFEIEIVQADLVDLKTVGDAVAYLEKLKAK